MHQTVLQYRSSFLLLPLSLRTFLGFHLVTFSPLENCTLAICLCWPSCLCRHCGAFLGQVKPVEVEDESGDVMSFCFSIYSVHVGIEQNCSTSQTCILVSLVGHQSLIAVRNCWWQLWQVLRIKINIDNVNYKTSLECWC